jgi:tetratricopeptide (TPR) repeat protein
LPEAGPEIPKLDELVGEEVESRGRYGRLIAIAVVLTTLIAALVAFAQAQALRSHDRADATAEQYGALALNAAAVNRGRAEVQIDRVSLLSQQVRQADDASLFEQYATASKVTTLLASRWDSIAAQTQSDTVAIAGTQGIPYICSPTIVSEIASKLPRSEKSCPATNAFYSSEQDPNFPNRYLQQSQYPTYRLAALRDASNQEADDAEAKFVHYAAALTMLAVAVFLFGYSLTPQGQARRILYSRVAAGFVLVAGVWALYQVLTPVSRPPDSAATAYAKGQVALYDGNDQAAIADYDRALSLRPQFVDAYVGRASAEYDTGIPHIGTGDTSVPTTAGPVTIPTTAAINKDVADLEHARDRGSDAATLFANLAGDLEYRGLIEHNSSDVLQSRHYAEAAAARFKDQQNAAALLLTTRFVLAEDDLALGDQASAAEYRAAESRLQAPGVNTEVAVASALTDLSLIANEHPALASKAGALKAQIVATGEAGYPTPNGYSGKGYANHVVQLSGIKAEPDPGHALYLINHPNGFNPNNDLLSAQWEYKDPVNGEWAVLPEISGPVNSGGLISLNPGYASNNPSYVSGTSPATCLPAGHYRVELYVNGRLAGSTTTTGSWPALQAVRFNEVDAAICTPQGWRAFPRIGPGADGSIAPDQSSGAFILSIPKAAAGSLAGNTAALLGVMESTVKSFSGSAGSVLPGIHSAGRAQSTPFFMSSSNGQQETWTYQHGVVLSGVGTAANGEVYVGMTWGPANGNLAEDLFLSLSPR